MVTEIRLYRLPEDPEQDNADSQNNHPCPEPSHGPERPLFDEIITPGVPLASFKQPIQPAQGHGRIPVKVFSDVIQIHMPLPAVLICTGLWQRVFTSRLPRIVTGAHLVVWEIYLRVVDTICNDLCTIFLCRKTRKNGNTAKRGWCETPRLRQKSAARDGSPGNAMAGGSPGFFPR